MKYLLLLIFAFYSLVSTAQSSDEAYIVDSDGYTNVRKAQSSTSAIITTIKTAELFECEPNKESSWWKVRTSNGTSGFIHKSRIVTVVSQAALISDLFEEIRKTNPNNVEFGEVSNEELFMFAGKSVV